MSSVFAAVSRLLFRFIAASTAQFGVIGSTAIREFIWANPGVSGVSSLPLVRLVFRGDTRSLGGT
jgi:hypothetical protein